jgi:hypothetical protein
MSTQICTGLVTNVASTPLFIPIHNYVSEFRIKNLTRSGVAVGSVAGALTSTRIVEAFWCDYMNQGTAQIIENGTVSGILAPMNNGYAVINGITYFNAANPPVNPVIAGASFTTGTVAITNPATATLNTTVFTTSAPHGFAVGDIVRIYNLPSAPQFGGLLMTVIAVGSTTTFTTLLDSVGATTSTFSVIKVGSSYLPPRALYYPEIRVIAAITNTNPMLITLLVAQRYDVGDVVTFDIPSIFGIPQLSPIYSGLPVEATVVAVNNAVGVQSLTVNINSTNFGVFGGTNGWVASTAYPYTFPFLIPRGEGNTNNLAAYSVLPSPLAYGNQDVLSFARQNQAVNGIIVGAGDGTNSATTGGIVGTTVDVWEWRALTSTQQYPQI